MANPFTDRFYLDFAVLLVVLNLLSSKYYSSAQKLKVHLVPVLQCLLLAASKHFWKHISLFSVSLDLIKLKSLL